MVICCKQVLVLPQSSVADHILLIVYSWGQGPPAVISVNPIVGIKSHRSVAVAVPVFAGAVLSVQLMVTFCGHVIVGAVSSVIKIICIQMIKFPLLSVALHVL